MLDKEISDFMVAIAQNDADAILAIQNRHGIDSGQSRADKGYRVPLDFYRRLLHCHPPGEFQEIPDQPKRSYGSTGAIEKAAVMRKDYSRLSDLFFRIYISMTQQVGGQLTDKNPVWMAHSGEASYVNNDGMLVNAFVRNESGFRLVTEA